MNNITVGRYIPSNSIIHKLNPHLKLITNIVWIVLVFVTHSFIIQGLLLLPIMFAFMISHSRNRQIVAMLKPVVVIGIFLFLVNTFVLQPQVDVYWKFHSFTVGYLTFKATLLIMIRIYTMIITTTLLTATTRPIGLTRAIEDLFWPLKFIKVPVHIIAMIISIALRFIPTLLAEAQRIMKAQASRGVDFKNGNLKTKSKAIMTLIIPLFVSAFGKAEDLGNAMETRGYDPYQKRTRYRIYPPRGKDLILGLFVIGTIVLIALWRNDFFLIPSWFV